MPKKKWKYEIQAHQLFISRFSVCFRLFWKNKPSKRKLRKVFFICLISLFTTHLQLIQRLLITFRQRKVAFDKDPPVFILGYWRSGTTHLHYLMSQDKQFGYLNNFQSFSFNICLVTGAWLKYLMARITPPTRFVDRMELTMDHPQEEEQNMANTSTRTGLLSLFFPKDQAYFQKYNLFRGISGKEKCCWQKKYKQLLTTISIANKYKPLLLKNPHNTSRVKELLELYPNAKFIYLHRNPYQVYPSMMRLFDRVIQSQYLQDPEIGFEATWTLESYKTIQEKYLAERALIPKGNLVEVSFDELEKTPMQSLERIYTNLSLSGFEQNHSIFEAYLESQKNYRKNVFKRLDSEVLQKIHKEWAFAFDAFQYSTDYPPSKKVQ